MSPRQHQSLGSLNLFQKSEFWYNEMEIHAPRNKDICTLGLLYRAWIRKAQWDQVEGF